MRRWTEIDAQGNTLSMTSATLAEIRAMKDRGELFATRPDAPEGPDLGEDFWANAVLRGPHKPLMPEDEPR